MTGRNLRLQTILGMLILNAIVLLAWSQPWFALGLLDGSSVVVAGDVAAPALTALALSGFALAGALTIAGPVFRVVLGVLAAALGALVVLSAAMALIDPVTASAAALTSATGLSGSESLAAFVSQVMVAPSGGTALGAGVLIVVAGVLTAVLSRRWPTSSRKYQAVRLEQADGSTIGDWDSLSDGRDPT